MNLNLKALQGKNCLCYSYSYLERLRNLSIYFGKKNWWIELHSSYQMSKIQCLHVKRIAEILSLCFSFQLYKIRRGRTRPQALLFLCMILLLIVLHTSYMIYSLAPQYVMYGSQNYLIEVSTNFKKKSLF